MLMLPEILWNEIKIFPQKKIAIGRPPRDARLVLSGIFLLWTVDLNGAIYQHVMVNQAPFMDGLCDGREKGFSIGYQRPLLKLQYE